MIARNAAVVVCGGGRQIGDVDGDLAGGCFLLQCLPRGIRQRAQHAAPEQLLREDKTVTFAAEDVGGEQFIKRCKQFRCRPVQVQRRWSLPAAT